MFETSTKITDLDLAFDIDFDYELEELILWNLFDKAKPTIAAAENSYTEATSEEISTSTEEVT